MNRIIVFICCILSAISVSAQEMLTLGEAIQIGLANNYDIKLSENTAETSKNNLRYGVWGMMPTVTGNLTDVNNITSSDVELTAGGSRTATNAKNTALNYGAGLNWKIFDGLQMFTNYDRLKEFDKLGELNVKLSVQTTIADIIAAYFDLVSQKQQLQATHTALEVSHIRLKNADSRYKMGKGSKLELLAAKVDLSADSSQLLKQEYMFSSSKTKLNELLARSLDITFQVADTIIIDQNLDYQNLKTLTDSQNPFLQTAVINQKIAELNLKEVKGARYPTVALTSGYNFAKTTSPPTGFSIKSNSHGFNYGLTASLNIFNGLQQNRNEKNARLEVENSKINQEKLIQNINAQLLNAFQNYQTSLKLVAVEQRNIDVAKENLDITLEKYRLGSIVPLELREAQRNYVNANARYMDAQYQAKLAEVSLKEIAGNIDL
ncbi:TolC family protein [Pseudopedobacter beijingensis]|uniref:TolC family protein n=1 Tax=Pseudopedobacter beijingensis TaxID=1207056 RepID=A0ABW4IB33_9SPHI